jgi:hypothetical protein
MRTSRIPHPPGSRYLIVHHYLVKRFGLAAAAVLGLLDFLDRAQPKPEMPLASRTRIIAELEGVVGRDAVDKALKTLLDAGVIKKVKIVTPGEKNINVFVEYALCADAIPQAVAANGDDDGGDDGGSSGSGGSGGDSSSGSGGSRNPGTPEIRSSGNSGNQESRGLRKSGLKSGVPDATYISNIKKEEEAVEERKKPRAAASLKTSAREAASTGRETISTGRRRRVRPSGIVCWYDSDHDEAERLENETNPDELTAAVQSVRSSGKEPVPGLVAMEIERLRKRREAEATRARLIATVAAPPIDPEDLAKGQKILESLRRQRASMVSGRTPTATPETCQDVIGGSNAQTNVDYAGQGSVRGAVRPEYIA